MSALSPAALVRLARDSLADAARLIRKAQASSRHAAWCAGSEQHVLKAAFLRQYVRDDLAEARAIIASARKLYASAMAQLAKRGQLRHTYGRAPWVPACNGPRWLAVVNVGAAGLNHVLPRAYGKRQSAQRAAARYVEKMRLSAACAEVSA